MYYLYVLKDPITNEIRYVGMTNRPKARFWEHKRDAEKGVKTHKANWIRSLMNNNQVPIMEIVKSVETYEEVKIEEISMISEMKLMGYNLTNLTSGGDGIPPHLMKKDHPIRFWNKGRKMSEESKRRLSNSRKGIIFSEDHKKRLSESKIGKRLPQEAIDRRNKTNSESVKVIDKDGTEYFFEKMRDAVKFTGVNSKQIKKLSYKSIPSRKGFRFFL